MSEAELATIADPAQLLQRAWELESAARQPERTVVLERLGELLRAGNVPPAPAGRSWELELLAEQALDAPMTAVELTMELLHETIALAERVVREAEPAHVLALGRAELARGRALAWIGTEEATREADLALAVAADRFHELGRAEWHGYTVCWRGHAVHFLSGDLTRAAELTHESLEILGPDSPRRSTVLSFHGEVLAALGDLDEAERALAEGDELAARAGDRKARSYIAWTQARVASSRGDAAGTEQLLDNVQRDWGAWGDTHSGGAFELDAAEMLDRLGRVAQAEAYLARALARGPQDDDWLRLTRATMIARSGDPAQAIEDLQRLARGEWLEKRLLWRHTLFTAWATFRAGREGAGKLAARALEQAVACGGVGVAQAGEPALVAALAPLAERAGSAHARELLLDGRPLLVRLFGTPRVVRADGTTVQLPAGQKGELVRMLAVSDAGLSVEMVLATFFPEAPEASARHRLRQLLTKLRSTAGELIVRDGDRLRLVPAWVDVREFLALVTQVRRLRGVEAVRLAYAALALRSGPLLPTDPYAPWTEAILERDEDDHLAVLDLIAADAAARGSHREALTALDAALERDPDDDERRRARLRHLTALQTRRAAGESEPPDAAIAERRHAPTPVQHRTAPVVVGADSEPARSAEAAARAAWSLARSAAVSGDALATERLLREAEHDGASWLDTPAGTAFLVDAAEQLDRLGLIVEAQDYLARAVRRRGRDGETIQRGVASLLARSGESTLALRALRDVAGDGWSLWRHTLLRAWATVRAGGDGAGELAARALEQAMAGGELETALTEEAELVRALAPLAEQAGSSHARDLLLDGRPLLIRLFGTPRVVRADGVSVALPAGKPGELVRMVALEEHGRPVDVVLEAFFPDAPASAARQRLRQVLTRLRAAAGELVVRDDEQLRLVPAWVDAREFLVAADRVRSLDGPRAVRAAHTALAHATEPLLPLDREAQWADAIRAQVEVRRLGLRELAITATPERVEGVA